MARMPRPGRIVGVSAIVIAGLAATVALGSSVIAVVFARTVITPPTRREEDLRILGYDGASVTLTPTTDALTPGRYSLWFAGDTGHARLGEIVARDAVSVTRRVLSVDFGDLAIARRARLSGWFYLGPGDLGYPFEDVAVPTELGPAPAWVIPADGGSDRWVIGVHGRAVTRREAVRAVPVFREAGYTSLLVSYRNDGDAPGSTDRRYALGDTEWRDVDAAIRFAIDHGAREIVLMGWSMGGATVLQAATRSPSAAVVRGVVLESPVVDWVTALHFQGVAYRLPRVIRVGILGLLSRRSARILTGLGAPIDLARLDWVARAAELDLPVLLLHSDDDGYIPSTASRALAEARPDIVTFESFSVARHTRLWNYDADRWNAAISRWLAALR